jgi:uncharacterized protein (DUF362 family)
MNDQNNNKISRRVLLSKAAKTGASIAVAGGLSYILYDRTGPDSTTGDDKLVTLNDYSATPKHGSTLSIVTGPDRSATVSKAIDLLGGIERFVKPDDTVLIKPNVAFATPAMLGATVNPDLITAVVKLCYNRGHAKQVIITDNPINDPASCFLLSGIGKAASLAGAKVIMPKPHLFKPTTLKGGKLITNWPVLYGPFKNVDKVIGISPVKDHSRSGASMSMKNWYGLLGGRRNIFHQDINTIISEVAQMIRPTFVILDATEVMMTNGPTGGSLADLKRKNTMIVSTDMVAADAFGATMLDLKANDLPFIAKAQAAGIGTADYKSLKPLFAEVNA